jgi:RimJ/RimL family protein N-acetyltransferase
VKPFDLTLRDGRRVRIRPIVPGDEGLMAAGFARLSPRSRFYRFHRPVDRLSPEELRHLAATDGSNHVAWGAIAIGEPGMPGVGVARYLRDPDEPARAEVAVTVVDDFQGAGLGRALAQTLALTALEKGIGRFVVRVMPSNAAGLRLIRRFGASKGWLERRDVVFEIPLNDGGRTFRNSRQFRSTPAEGTETVAAVSPSDIFPRAP